MKSPEKSTVGKNAVVGMPADVARVYKPREGLVLQFGCEFGNVDLTTINMDFADQLFAAGYLVKKDEA